MKIYRDGEVEMPLYLEILIYKDYSLLLIYKDTYKKNTYIYITVLEIRQI